MPVTLSSKTYGHISVSGLMEYFRQTSPGLHLFPLGVTQDADDLFGRVSRFLH